MSESFNSLGHQIFKIEIPDIIQNLIKTEQWQKLDRELGILHKEKWLHQYFSPYIENYDLEYILSVRQPPDEDGIWHDDGSRDLAFVLFLNKNYSGGELNFRPKDNKEKSFKFSSLEPGSLVIFKTGKDHFEHCVSAVNCGLRVVNAGWLTKK